MTVTRRLTRLLGRLLVAFPLFSAGAVTTLPAIVAAKPIDRVAEIRRRLLAVDEHWRGDLGSSARETRDGNREDDPDAGRVAQNWPNWPNWPNWRNWNNWPNWRNW